MTRDDKDGSGSTKRFRLSGCVTSVEKKSIHLLSAVKCYLITLTTVSFYRFLVYFDSKTNTNHQELFCSTFWRVVHCSKYPRAQVFIQMSWIQSGDRTCGIGAVCIVGFFNLRNLCSHFHHLDSAGGHHEALWRLETVFSQRTELIRGHFVKVLFYR